MILLMEEILHQFIGSLSGPINYKVLYIPGGAGFLPSTVWPLKMILGQLTTYNS